MEVPGWRSTNDKHQRCKGSSVSVIHNAYDTPRWVVAGSYISASESAAIERAGCIFYTFAPKRHNEDIYLTDRQEMDIYFLFGEDGRTQELTDFGGKRKAGETIYQCAAREASEETLSIFGRIQPEWIVNCPALYNKKMYISFIHIDSSSFNEANACSTQFQRSYRSFVDRYGFPPEVSGLRWLSLDELKSALSDNNSSNTIYRLVKSFLSSGFHLHNEKRSFFNLHLFNSPSLAPSTASSFYNHPYQSQRKRPSSFSQEEKQGNEIDAYCKPSRPYVSNYTRTKDYIRDARHNLGYNSYNKERVRTK